MLVDASQSVLHESIDVRDIDCEYLCFSGHKIGAPAGIGILYAKRDRLERLTPSVLGGGTVDEVSLLDHIPSNLPQRLEPGTPNFEGAIGLAAACDFLRDQDLGSVRAHAKNLTQILTDGLLNVPGVTILGPREANLRAPIVSFTVEGLESHATARMLSNRFSICVRSGFHCAQPAHLALQSRPSVRASLALFNTETEVRSLIGAMETISANLN